MTPTQAVPLKTLAADWMVEYEFRDGGEWAEKPLETEIRDGPTNHSRRSFA
jgi:hypothetical protein